MLSDVPAIYPVHVPDDSPVLRGLEMVEIAERDPQLPALYKYIGQHLSHRVKFPSSITYVLLVDPSTEGKEVYDAISDAQEVPSGPIAGLCGLVEVGLGDALLARPIDQDRDPAADALQILVGIKLVRESNAYMGVLLRGGYTQEDIIKMLDDVDAARKTMLGTREERAKTPGKVSFEHHWRAQSLNNAPRCYGMNSMVQQPRQVEGPPAPLKTTDNEADEYQRMVHGYLLATTKLNVAAFEMQGPSALVNSMTKYSCMINSPRLGNKKNAYWGSQQTNCACPQHRSKEKRLDQQMGHFGGPHKDIHDFAAGLTCALCLSDLSDEPGCEPGRLHFLGQGVWVRLEYMTQVFFSGLLRHGGTSPLVPDDQIIEGWETRMLLISYPPTSMITGKARHPYSAIPYQDQPLYLSPEMTGAPLTANGGKKWTNSCHYAGDGWVTMEPESLFNWMARGLLQQGHFAFRQLPSSFKVNIDPELFLKTFTMESNGVRVEAEPWELAPNSMVQEPFSQRHRAVQDALLIENFDHYMRGIPMVKENKYSTWDITTQQPGTRTKTSTGNKGKSKRVADPDAASDVRPSKRGRWDKVAVAHAEYSAASDFPMADRNLSLVWAAMQKKRLSPSECVDQGIGYHDGTGSSADAGPSRLAPEPPSFNDLGEDEIESDVDDENTVLPSRSDSTREVPLSTRISGTYIERAMSTSRSYSPPRVTGPVSPPSAVRPCRRTARTTGKSPAQAAPVSQASAPTSRTCDLSQQDASESTQVIESPTSFVDDDALPQPRTHSRQVVTRGTRTEYIGAPPPHLLCNGTAAAALHADELEHPVGLDLGVCVDLRGTTPRDRSRGACRQQFFSRVLIDGLKLAVEDVLSVDIQDTSNQALRDALDELDCVDALTVDSGKPLSDTQLPQYSASVKNMSLYCSGQAIWINFYRQRTILSESHIFDSIEDLIAGQCTRIVREKSDTAAERNWLARLVKSVRGLLRQGLRVVASSDNFIGAGVIRSIVYTAELGPGGKPSRPRPYEIEKETLFHVRQILHLWMGSTHSFVRQAQTHVASCLQHYFGPGCLLLPSIWPLYQTVPHWLFTHECPKFSNANSFADSLFSVGYLDDLRETLDSVVSSYPEIVGRVDALQEAYLDLYMRTCVHKHGQAASTVKQSNLKKMLHAASRKPDLSHLNATSQVNTNWIHLHLLSWLAAPSKLLQSAVHSTKQERAVVAVVQFLEDSYVVARHLNEGCTSSSAFSPAQHLVLSNTDFYMPLREMARSRRIMGDMLSTDLAGSRAGLFSLQVFRFIHFNTEAFILCPDDLCKVYFESEAEYKGYLDDLVSRFPMKPDGFFCNKKAFGTTIFSRTHDRYSDYWEASQHEDITWPPPRDFATAWKSLRESKNKFAQARKDNANDRDLWEGVGTLCLYMFLADLHAVGLVDSPTTTQVAKIVAELRAGGVSGLEAMGYLDGSHGGKRVEQAFAKFYGDVSGSLSEEQVQRLQWNPITAEHTLCKMLRMLKRDYCTF
ncbi:hypothetical protein BDY19DRAFT_991480 [Irpex rosettiformis]|uniref:Uncharacterized protein n=1 Tax=Irpex rosettiformis TaxID=378272 RepID=A0ACB8UC26_9APHY|nr:hypothetical protein BDY19DRAFT_991480 [Irpex rosettiformis]